MSYEPTEWKNGDIVTSNKLNKLENGVEDAGILTVGFSDNEQTTLNKTFAEINAAMLAGRVCSIIVIFPGAFYDDNVQLDLILNSGANETLTQIDSYIVTTLNGNTYTTNAVDDYPVLEQ